MHVPVCRLFVGDCRSLVDAAWYLARLVFKRCMSVDTNNNLTFVICNWTRITHAWNSRQLLLVCIHPPLYYYIWPYLWSASYPCYYYKCEEFLQQLWILYVMRLPIFFLMASLNCTATDTSETNMVWFASYKEISTSLLKRFMNGLKVLCLGIPTSLGVMGRSLLSDLYPI